MDLLDVDLVRDLVHADAAGAFAVCSEDLPVRRRVRDHHDVLQSRQLAGHPPFNFCGGVVQAVQHGLRVGGAALEPDFLHLGEDLLFFAEVRRLEEVVVVVDVVVPVGDEPEFDVDFPLLLLLRDGFDVLDEELDDVFGLVEEGPHGAGCVVHEYDVD